MANMVMLPLFSSQSFGMCCGSTEFMAASHQGKFLPVLVEQLFALLDQFAMMCNQ